MFIESPVWVLNQIMYCRVLLMAVIVHALCDVIVLASNLFVRYH